MTATAEVLVTGATGFLGRHLLEQLHHAGKQTVALVRRPETWAEDAGPEIAGHPILQKGSPIDVSPDAPGFEGVKTIVHAAAVVKHSRQAPPDLWPLNVEGTLNMVRVAAKRRARMIFVSTSGTVGCTPFPDVTADEDAPYAEKMVGRWPYYASKIKAEQEAKKLAEKLGVELVIVRPPVMLGPGDHRFRATGTVLKLMSGKFPLHPNGGMNFTDIRDVTAAIVKLVDHPSPRPIYHTPGTECSGAAFFKMVETVCGVPGPKHSLPQPLLETTFRSLHGAFTSLGVTPPHAVVDPVVVEMSGAWWGLRSLWAERELGYKQRAPMQTLVDTVDWIRRHHPDFMGR